MKLTEIARNLRLLARKLKWPHAHNGGKLPDPAVVGDELAILAARIDRERRALDERFALDGLDAPLEPASHGEACPCSRCVTKRIRREAKLRAWPWMYGRPPLELCPPCGGCDEPGPCVASDCGYPERCLRGESFNLIHIDEPPMPPSARLDELAARVDALRGKGVGPRTPGYLHALHAGTGPRHAVSVKEPSTDNAAEPYHGMFPPGHREKVAAHAIMYGLDPAKELSFPDHPVVPTEPATFDDSLLYKSPPEADSLRRFIKSTRGHRESLRSPEDRFDAAIRDIVGTRTGRLPPEDKCPHCGADFIIGEAHNDGCPRQPLADVLYSKPPERKVPRIDLHPLGPTRGKSCLKPRPECDAYYCECHARLGNEFYFLPADRCLYDDKTVAPR